MPDQEASPQANSPPGALPLPAEAPPAKDAPPALPAPAAGATDNASAGSTPVEQNASAATPDAAAADAAAQPGAVTDGAQAEDAPGSVDAQDNLLALLPESIRAKAERRDEAPATLTEPVEAAIVEKVRAVFVPSPNYLREQGAIEVGYRLWVISGPPQSGRFTCAIQLGLALLGQGRPVDHELYGGSESSFAEGRPLEAYEPGLTVLRRRLESLPDTGIDEYEWDDLRDEVQSLEAQLADNLRHGYDNENLRSDRYRILGMLNQHAIRLFGASFRAICRWPERYGGPARALPSKPRVQLIPKWALDRRTIGALVEADQEDQEDQEKQEKQAKPVTIYLCERAFEIGVRVHDLDEPLLKLLTKKDCYLLLTTEGRGMAAQAGRYGHISTHIDRASVAAQPFLKAVLESHLDFYGADMQLSVDLREKVEQLGDGLLREALRRPFAIDLFCSGLRDLTPGAQEEEIRALADRVGDLSPGAVRPWFQGLAPNVRLYALLVVIFQDANYQYLEELYARAVVFLRQDGVAGLGDPRDLSLAELRNQARVRVTAAGGLQFNHKTLADEVHSQLASYHPAIWSICERILMPLVVEEGGPTAPARPILGAAIGQVGLHHLPKLDLLLDALADHEDGAVAATAGHVLKGVVGADPSRAVWVADKLWVWARSRLPLRMWTASTSIWHVYEYIATHAPAALPRLRASLTDLATNPHQFDKSIRDDLEQQAEALAPSHAVGGTTSAERERFIRNELKRLEDGQIDVLTYALTQIARYAVADVVELVSSWLKDPPRSKQHWVGTLAALRLMEVPHTKGPPRLLVERHGSLLALVGPMLDTEVRALRVLLDILRRWAFADGWDARIAATLLTGIANVPWSLRRELARLIGELWVDGDPPVPAVARQVIARSCLLDGWPADAAGDPLVVLVERLGPSSSQRLFRERLARRLAMQLAPVAPVALATLGEARSSTAPGLAVPPRLALPVLESVGGRTASLAVVLAWEVVLDLEDLGQGYMANQVVYGPLAPELPCPPGVAPVDIPSRITAGPAAKLLTDTALPLFARGMVGRDLAGWWRRLAPLVGQDRPEPRALLERLITWAAELAATPPAPEEDPLRKFIATVCWLSAADLKGCVDRLIIWMCRQDEHLRLASGAAARALFRLFGSAEPPPPVATHAELLRLVVPLAAQGWPSVEAILFAARRWAREEGWAARLLAGPDGASGELLALIDSLAPDDRPHLAALLAAWPLPDDPDPAPYHIEVGETLALQQARGPGGALPALVAGQTYGLLVLPSAPNPEQVELARETARELLVHHADTIKPVLLSQGQVAPLACPSQECELDNLSLAPGGAPPALLGPLLGRASPVEVGFVVVIGLAPALDEEDWYTSRWADLIVLYRDDVARHVPFKTLTPVHDGVESGKTPAARLVECALSRGPSGAQG